MPAHLDDHLILFPRTFLAISLDASWLSHEFLNIYKTQYSALACLSSVSTFIKFHDILLPAKQDTFH